VFSTLSHCAKYSVSRFAMSASPRSTRASSEAPASTSPEWAMSLDEADVVIRTTGEENHCEFRVHRHILKHHSSFFNSIFLLPQPKNARMASSIPNSASK
jgi:hypothetical protein